MNTSVPPSPATPGKPRRTFRQRARSSSSQQARGLDALLLFHPERIGHLTSFVFVFVFVSTERPMALGWQ